MGQGAEMVEPATVAAASQRVPAILYTIAAVLGAVGQYFYKRGGQAKGLPLYRNVDLAFGVLAFTVVTVLFLFAYRLGGRISFVYPFYATTFLWGTLLGVVVEEEPWSPVQIVGVVVVVVGIALIAGGSPR